MASSFTRWTLCGMLAMSDVEWEVVQAHSRARQEVGFHALALVLSPVFFWFAIDNVAVNLFGYPVSRAAALALVVTVGLFAVDRYFLLQSRGAPETTRGAIRRIRFVSFAIIGLSYGLMGIHTFKGDINRLLFEGAQRQRAVLEQSPEYAAGLKSARNALTLASVAAGKAASLQVQIANLKARRAVEQAGYVNQCEGNTTDGKTRLKGCGPIARGHRVAEQALDQQILATKQELARFETTAGQQSADQTRLDRINEAITAEVNRTTDGPTERLDALWHLLRTRPSAAFVCLFWVLIGMIPDAVMFFAQSQPFNHALFVRVRQMENEVIEAKLGNLRAELRRRQAADLAPLEVRLTAVAQAQQDDFVGLASSTADGKQQSNYQERQAA